MTKEQIQTLLPALRSVRAQNLVKSILTVEPIGSNPVVRAESGMIYFQDTSQVVQLKERAEISLPTLTYRMGLDYDIQKLFEGLQLEFPGKPDPPSRAQAVLAARPDGRRRLPPRR